jgi:glycerol-3-phosphate dehydrogenase
VQLKNFNKASRTLIYQHLKENQYDVIVIGGGITGASIFSQAVLCGLKTALVEARDIASGTSSLSSKLIHGGLRYIKTLNFKLTRESCKERNHHLRVNKRLVKPIPFLIPVYKGSKYSGFSLKAALTLYDTLSSFKNYRNHHFLSRDEVMLKAPSLSIKNLLGGYVYYDAIVNDSRLTLETLKQGVSNGGMAINYAKVTSLIKSHSKISGVKIEDYFTGNTYHIKGRCVINATGVYTDSIRRLNDPNCRPLLALSRGAHLVFKLKDIPINITLTFFSPIDGRVLFLIKHDDCFLYGTTDDWSDADPVFPGPENVDVNYLLYSINMFMPRLKLNRDHVLYAYSGYRPLVCKQYRNYHPSTASRKDYFEVSSSGLITVTGGKLTTARIMAQKALKLACKNLGRKKRLRIVNTHMQHLGGSLQELQKGLDYWIKKKPDLSKYFALLYNKYGPDGHELCNKLYIRHRKNPGKLAYELQNIELSYICSREMVCTLSDLVQRRMDNLSWRPNTRLGFLISHKKTLQNILNLTDIEYQKQYDEYKQYLQDYHRLAIKGENNICNYSN